MASEYLELVGTITDAEGEPVEISIITGAEGGYGDDGEPAAVYLDFLGSATLDKAAREDFQRLFMEAGRRAEAHAAGEPDGQ